MLADWLSASCSLWLGLRSEFAISPCRVVQLALVSLFQAFRCLRLKIQIQHYTVDHLAWGSMKNGANSEMPCELQDTWTSTLWTHIAEISSSCFHTWLRVGLTSIKQLAVLHWAVTEFSLWILCSSKICWLSVQSLNSWDFSSWVVSHCCSLAGWTFLVVEVSTHTVSFTTWV